MHHPFCAKCQYIDRAERHNTAECPLCNRCKGAGTLWHHDKGHFLLWPDKNKADWKREQVEDCHHPPKLYGFVKGLYEKPWILFKWPRHTEQASLFKPHQWAYVDIMCGGDCKKISGCLQAGTSRQISWKRIFPSFIQAFDSSPYAWSRRFACHNKSLSGTCQHHNNNCLRTGDTWAGK